ncbi:MAG: (d)CMP kinase [Candidatus Stahlbacteria bacterium]|nr:MAG: (d)CMP kinase [Candidatus Stahlbacteria bacterium]
MAKFVVAIDGGAGSGKSTTAKAVAKRLKFFYLDTGAMYRAATLKYLRCGGSTDNIDTALVREIIKHTVINLRQEGSKILVFLDNKDVTLEIRTTPVNNFVSPISALPEIREWMVQKQREVAEGKNVICEGRDIGTVVFPDAQVKIYMQADLKIRAQRRQKELDEKNIEADFNKVVENLKFRDKYDSNRVHSPLKKAEDAIILDTTDITIEQEVDFVEKIVRERLKEIPKIQNT